MFGASVPLAKELLATLSPWLLADLLYLGSGLGLTAFRRFRKFPPVRLVPVERGWLAAAIFCGGCVGPVLLMVGLSAMPASKVSLLLNAEGVFTALLSWFVFRENFNHQIALGMTAIVAGAVILSWPGNHANTTGEGSYWPAVAVLGACFAWALDNNFTRKLSLTDATWLASIKGLSAGTINLVIAVFLGASPPKVPQLAGALALGCFAYGVSLVLFVVALRNLGTARTGSYFSLAPFFGALLAIPLLGESVTNRLLIAGALMLLGVWLHLTERHGHMHTHEFMAHTHDHEHDEHHLHQHQSDTQAAIRHSHWHQHPALTHTHTHVPDAHHRHDH